MAWLSKIKYRDLNSEIQVENKFFTSDQEDEAHQYHNDRKDQLESEGNQVDRQVSRVGYRPDFMMEQRSSASNFDEGNAVIEDGAGSKRFKSALMNLTSLTTETIEIDPTIDGKS